MKLRVKRIIFIGIIFIGAICASWLRWPLRFQTDLTSLIKMDAGTNWPVSQITERFSSVVNVVVQSNDRISGEIVANQIRDRVNNFPELTLMVGDLSPKAFVSTLGKYHNLMLSERDRELLHDKKYEDITNNANVNVETSMMPPMLPLTADPFLLFTNYIADIKNGGTGWIVQNGMMWQYDAPYNYYMLPINVNVSDATKLSDVMQRFKSSIADINFAETRVYMGGAPLHTAEMYRHSKIELGIISVLGLIAVLVLNYCLFRRMVTVIPIGLSLIVGYIVGTIVLFLCFGEPHILVFVFGTSLIGLGIDYAFHFMCIAPQDDSKTVQKNILHSLITTLICFAPLMFASVGVLRQISVFTMVGLLSIYAYIKLFVPFGGYCIPNNVRYVAAPINRRYRPYIIAGIAVISIVVCMFARIENNMAAMYRPTHELGVAEQVIGKLNNVDKSAFLIVRGHNVQDVLETEEAIRDSGTRFVGISSLIPSAKRQYENSQMVQELYKSQSKNIKKLLGLKKTPQFTDIAPITIDSPDLDSLKSYFERFLISVDDYVYGVSSVSADAKIVNDNAKIVAPAQQIQNQMNRFSDETYNLLLICGAVLMIGLAWLYGRRAFSYLVPPLLGVIVSVALLTIFGVPITFFHLLGLFIVIGLGLDYAIFHINMRNSTELRPVFYSFLTSFIGLGLLAFTSFFLIAALGMILAIGIAVSYVVSLYLFRNQ